MATTAVVVAVPAIYYANWIMLWLGTHNPNEWTQQEYLQLLLRRETLTVRQTNGGIIRVSGLEVANARDTRCETEIVRLPVSSFLPSYERVTYCHTDVRLRSVQEGIAAWKIYKKSDTTIIEGRQIVTSYWTAGSVDPAEAAALLCKMGRC